MHKNSKIYIAGHKGLVGSAIKRQLESQGYTNSIYKTHKELDLINAEAVLKFFATEKPEYVILAAAKVGGILANNTYRADFIYQNLQIQNNIIHNSYLYGVKKLLFLGSTCIYPKNALQPIKEEYLLTNTLEYTNEPYAIAKIAGLKMCESYNLQYGTNFISVMPTNLYGINDNFDLEHSHVLPALLRKIHLAKLYHQNKQDAILQDLKMQNFEEAKNYLHRFGIQPNCVEIWGSGNPRREFLYADDMANACVFIMQNLDFKDLCTKDSTQIRNTHINIGTGEDISIKELALLIKDIVGFEGSFEFNTQKPDGTMLKRTDISKLSTLGWNPKTSLREGIRKVYESYVQR